MSSRAACSLSFNYSYKAISGPENLFLRARLMSSRAALALLVLCHLTIELDRIKN